MKNKENQQDVKHKNESEFIYLKHGHKRGTEVKLKRIKGLPTILHSQLKREHHTVIHLCFSFHISKHYVKQTNSSGNTLEQRQSKSIIMSDVFGMIY